jgi:hypothetical protein
MVPWSSIPELPNVLSIAKNRAGITLNILTGIDLFHRVLINPQHLSLSRPISQIRELVAMTQQNDTFAIYVFDPACPDCCCNDCDEPFSWDGSTRPSCPSCNSKNVRSA